MKFKAYSCRPYNDEINVVVVAPADAHDVVVRIMEEALTRWLDADDIADPDAYFSCYTDVLEWALDDMNVQYNIVFEPYEDRYKNVDPEEFIYWQAFTQLYEMVEVG